MYRKSEKPETAIGEMNVMSDERIHNELPNEALGEENRSSRENTQREIWSSQGSKKFGTSSIGK